MLCGGAGRCAALRAWAVFENTAAALEKPRNNLRHSHNHCDILNRKSSKVSREGRKGRQENSLLGELCARSFREILRTNPAGDTISVKRMEHHFHTAAESAPERRSEKEPFRFKIVIAGAGFAGVYCAKELGRLLGKEEAARDVALISDRNYMVFQPMLPEVCGSEVSPRHVVNPIRRLCRRVTVMRGEIERIHLAERRLTINAGVFAGVRQVEFQHLALCIGSAVDLSKVPGMPEHAYLMNNVGDAMELRGTIIDRFEEASLVAGHDFLRRLLTFIVVGGGLSGTETVGQIADLVRDVGFLYPGIKPGDIRVVLIHSGSYLMPEMGEHLGRYAQEKLERRGVEVILNTRVRAMTSGKVYLTDGGVLESHTVVSTVGNAPSPLVSALCAQNGIPTEKGRMLAEPTLQVRGQPALWSAGDCAVVRLPDGRKAPSTAQFAIRQGELLGRNLAAALEGKAPQPFTFTGLGELATVGRRAAVADILGFQFSGFFAWWLWRTIYLAKLPGLDRKLRVMIEWTFDLFFPRDISLLSPRPSEVLQEVHLEAGDFVFQAGDPACSFYILKCGLVEVRDSQGRVIRSFTNGEHFGERALLADRVWRYDAAAVEPCELVAMPASVFDRLQASKAFRNLVEESRKQ